MHGKKQENMYTILDGRSRYRGELSPVRARRLGPKSFCSKYLVITWQRVQK